MSRKKAKAGDPKTAPAATRTKSSGGRKPPEDSREALKEILGYTLYLEEQIQSHRVMVDRLSNHSQPSIRRHGHASARAVERHTAQLGKIWASARKQFTEQFVDYKDDLFSYKLKLGTDILVAFYQDSQAKWTLQVLREHLVAAGFTISEDWEPEPASGDTFDGWKKHAYEVIGNLVSRSGRRVSEIIRNNKDAHTPKGPFGTLSFPGPIRLLDDEYILSRIMHLLGFDPAQIRSSTAILSSLSNLSEHDDEE